MTNYYVKTDGNGLVIAHSSDMALSPHEIEHDGWNSIPASIEGELVKDGVPLYKFKNGVATRRTEKEIKADTLQMVVKPMIAAKTCETKSMLAEYLAAHPINSAAHGGAAALYSVTSEKQALLTSTILMAQGAAMMELPYELTWNAAGQPCETWTMPELQQLAFEIAAYVKPLVSYQQHLEMTLNACTTVAEVEAVEIDYSGVTGGA